MLIDTHSHVGRVWSHQPELTPDAMLRWMDDHGIAQAVLLPLESPEGASFPIVTREVLSFACIEKHLMAQRAGNTVIYVPKEGPALMLHIPRPSLRSRSPTPMMLRLATTAFVLTGLTLLETGHCASVESQIVFIRPSGDRRQGPIGLEPAVTERRPQRAVWIRRPRQPAVPAAIRAAPTESAVREVPGLAVRPFQALGAAGRLESNPWLAPA